MAAKLKLLLLPPAHGGVPPLPGRPRHHPPTCEQTPITSPGDIRISQTNIFSESWRLKEAPWLVKTLIRVSPQGRPLAGVGPMQNDPESPPASAFAHCILSKGITGHHKEQRKPFTREGMKDRGAIAPTAAPPPPPLPLHQGPADVCQNAPFFSAKGQKTVPRG